MNTITLPINVTLKFEATPTSGGVQLAVIVDKVESAAAAPPPVPPPSA
jgi:hypothetical protein